MLNRTKNINHIALVYIKVFSGRTWIGFNADFKNNPYCPRTVSPVSFDKPRQHVYV